MSTSIPMSRANPAEVIDAPPAPTSGLSTAGFVLAFVFALAGLIVFLVARQKIDQSHGTLGGRGLATEAAK